MSWFGRLLARLLPAAPALLYDELGEPVGSIARAQRITRWLASRWRGIRRAIESRRADADAEGRRLADELVPARLHGTDQHLSLATILAHEIRRGLAHGCNPFDDPGPMLRLQLSGGKDL